MTCDKSDNYEQIRISFVRSLFSSQLYFRSCKTKVDSIGNIYVTIPPKTWESEAIADVQLNIYHLQLLLYHLNVGDIQTAFLYSWKCI